MKRFLFSICLLVACFTVHSQNFSSWTGSGNWSNTANWSNGTSYGQLQFTGAGNLTNCISDTNMSQWRLYFSAGNSYNITGSGVVSLFDFGGNNSWILSDATVLQTLNFPISFSDGGARSAWITARSTGGMTFNGNLATAGNITGVRIANTNAASFININTLSGSKPIIIGRDNVDANQANTRVTITGNNSGYTGTATVQAGTLFVNGNTSSSTSVTVASGATIAGSGTIAGTVSVSGTASPGGTAATTANLTTGNMTFNGSSTYRVEMNNATGTAGNASGWDKITSTGSITCSASPITLALVSLSVANFNPANSYTWPIASGSSISGFSSSNFTINTAGFTSFTGTFAVTLSGGNTINLVYSPPSSAPAQPSAISGAIAVCNGTSQTYSVTNDVNATSYEWTLPSGWTGTSSTNSITVTVADPGGSISVIARNASGDSLPSALVVSVGVSTSITTQPATSPQSVCLGSSVTPLSVVAAGGGLTYQWYSNSSASNSGGTLINGATASSYTPSYVDGTAVYYYCVVGGLCAPTSITSDVSGAVTIGGFPNDSGTYTITTGGNGGQGFGPWSLSVSGGSGGTFNGGSDIGQSWGIYANSGGLTSAVRPFAGPLAIGNTVSFAYDNGGIEVNGNKVGVRLRNSSNNILSEFRFTGGDTQYFIADAATTNTGVNFTTTGLSNVTFAYTAANTYSLSITRSGVTTVLTGRTFSTAVGGQVPAQIEFFNSNAGGGSARDVFFTNLTIGYPMIFTQPSSTVQEVCQNTSATTLSVDAYGSNLGYQWYSNPGGITLNGQTASTFSPPTTATGAYTYYCVVSYTGSCGSAPSITSSSSGTITVNGTPTASISGTSTVCQNGSASLTFTGSNGTPPYEFQYTVYEIGSIIPPGLATVTTTSGNSVTVTVPSSTLGGTLYDLIGVSSGIGSAAVCSGSASGSVTVTVNAATTFYTDADGDAFGDLSSPVVSCNGSTPSGTVSDATDCDDNDPSAHEKFSFYADADGDTFGFGSLVEVCAADVFSPPLGYSLDNTDCDDTDSRKTITYPFYADLDGDTYGAGSLVQACAINDLTPPTNYSLDGSDCDDTNALKHTTFSFYVDADGDTFGSTTTALACAVDGMSPPSGFSLNDTDCDDTNALKTITYLYYVDADGDSYGSTTSELLCTVNATSPPTGYSASNTDCDDADPLKFNLFSFYEDLDGDTYGSGAATFVCGQNSVTPPTGYSLDGTDCDDTDDTIYRNNQLYTDADGDGYDTGMLPPTCFGALPVGTSLTTLGYDCDDADDTIYRSALLYADLDGDGYTIGGQTPTCYGAILPTGTSLTSLGIDCDDNNPAIYQPGSLFVDVDGDTYTAGPSSISCYGASLPVGTTLLNNPTDCDDNDATKHQTFGFHRDLDGDGFGSGNGVFVCAVDQSTPPTGYSNDNSDCDDADQTIYRSATLYTDIDGDTYTVGSGVVTCYGATLPTGKSLTTSGEDCDDADALIYRSATLYTDVDGDTYTVGAGVETCYGANLPTGKSLTTSGEDCDDAIASIYRSATLYTDVDADGYDVGSAVVCYGATLPTGKSLTTSGSDCDDLNPAVHQSQDLYADSDNDGFGAITATAVCAPVSCSSNTIAINFRVDMTGQSITSGGVHIAGNFASQGSTTITNDWSPDAPNSQLRAIGGNIYEITILFPATSAGSSLEFKFLRSNGWNSGADQYSEQNISSSCGASGNRLLVLPSKFLSFNTAYDQCPTSLQKFLCTNTDCDDTNATKNTPFPFYVDADGDTYGAGSLVSVCALNGTTPPTGYALTDTDCDDADALIYRSATLYTDADQDTYTIGSGSVVCYGAALPTGTTLTASSTQDCDDTNALIYRSATLYTDADADGYDAGSAIVCYGATLPVGTSLTTSGSDCDDANDALHQAFGFYTDADSDTYGAGSEVMVCAANPNQAPTGYALNNTDCDDANSNIYQFATFYVDADGDTYGSTATASVCSGLNTPTGYATTNDDCDDTNPALNPTNPCATGKVVNLTLFIQDYYVGSSSMNSVKLNQDYESQATDVEDLTVELHDALDYSLVDTAIGTLHTDGSLQVTFSTAAAGDYYIAVKGRNIIQTWTATPQTISTTPLDYDFSSSASQAYEDNMAEVEPGVFAFFSGDLNQDEAIDNSDTTDLENDISNSNFGVLATDLNGDGAVDNSDTNSVYFNIDNSVYSHHPF